MASAFSHALMAVSIGTAFSSEVKTWKFYLAGAVCAVIPDADVIMFSWGFPYEHVLGHRGFTHSLLFSFLLGFLVSLLFCKPSRLIKIEGMRYVLYFFLCTLSHAFLDAMTSGGLGVAIFAPFENSRYFLPFRPIQVSPIGISNFFSDWGVRVIKSEIKWVAVPCLCFMLLTELIRKAKSYKSFKKL